jgi:hypothetical protein
MVEFRKDGYSIHVHLGCNPAEDWLELVKELIEVMAAIGDETPVKPWRTLYFLQECMPDWESAKKMVV